MTLQRQHLIDPEICIRCNTCEETCPVDAVSHNEDNYIVDPEKCNFCLDCISPCPTGAIDNWRTVAEPYSLAEQGEWDELPEQVEHEDDAVEVTASSEVPSEPDESEALITEAHNGATRLVPPFSAAHPYVRLYSRSNPAIATVVGNHRVTDSESESDTHHIVLDFGKQAFPVLEGQSVGVIPPGEDESGRPHRIRLYSVASPRDGERPNYNNIALTVKREVTEVDGILMPGVASNYLCDLQRGDEVRITGPFGDTFLMPNHPASNIIMVCTGTGSAPFRAMTERRRRRMPHVPGKLLLFFGARTPEELPYLGPLKKLPEELIEVDFAFSRVKGEPRRYVQDRILGRRAEIVELLEDENTHVFICGIKGMEKGVYEAFETVCQQSDKDWDGLYRRMWETGRYHTETY